MTARPLIGMMLGWTVRQDLMRACSLAASHYGADFYYFHTRDIKEDTIVGMQLEDNKWIEREFRYPDVIYDNVRRRGKSLFKEAYRKLERVPMGHTLEGRSMGKTKVYNLLRGDEDLKRHLIPFMTMRDAEKTLGFIDKHQQVVLKPDGGAMGANIFTAESGEDGIQLFDQQYVHNLNREETLKTLDLLIAKKYCAQKMIRSVTPHGYPFHIRVHASKNGQNQWVIAYKSVTLSLMPHVKITNSDLTYRGTSTWPDFLLHQFGEAEGGPMDDSLGEYGIRTAQYLEERIGSGFHELGLDLGVDAEGKFWLFEAGLGLPRSPYYQMQGSLPAMAYTLYVLARHRGEQTDSGRADGERDAGGR